MAYGLACNPLRCTFGLPAKGPDARKKQSAYFSQFLSSNDSLCMQRNSLRSVTWMHKQRAPSLVCATEATYGNFGDDSTDVFPRINVGDPYKRLGISREASEDEIQSARNFLMQTYGHHKRSVDAIESAHDKIIMQKFNERRRPKINIKKKVREVSQHRYVQAVISRFRAPAIKFIIQTSIVFIILGVLTLLFPTEEGPTLQVAASLFISVYFIHERLKTKLRSFLYGAGSFIFAWLLGTFLWFLWCHHYSKGQEVWKLPLR